MILYVCMHASITYACMPISCVCMAQNVCIHTACLHAYRVFAFLHAVFVCLQHDCMLTKGLHDLNPKPFLFNTGTVTITPPSGKGGLGFKFHPGRFSFRHQVVYTWIEECCGGRSLTQWFTSTSCSCERVYWRTCIETHDSYITTYQCWTSET